MSALPKISIRLDGAMRPSECVALATAAEAAGFAAIWFAENAFARGIVPAAAACAVATRTIQINAGVFNPYTRHPAMIAMETGALDELSNGRAGLGLGAGIAAATKRLGLDADKPLPALRDALTIIRGLLKGESVEHEGAWFSAKSVALDYRTRPDIPIYLAGRGPLTVKFAGEAADGLIVSNMCAVASAGRLAEMMNQARSAAGRADGATIAQYMPCAVGSDGNEARRRARIAVGQMLPRYWGLGAKVAAVKEALQTGTDIDDADFSNAARRIQAGATASDVLDDRFTGAFALSGTAGECLDLAAGYRAAGITELALTFAGPNAAEEIRALGRAAGLSGREA
jgi:5,10-methylenetetrahydromethanopterin reductase